jgi:hypothetical protein
MTAIRSILRRREPPASVPPPLTNGEFEEIGLDIVLGPYHTCAAKGERLRKFESFFGAEPFYCAILGLNCRRVDGSEGHQLEQ